VESVFQTRSKCSRGGESEVGGKGQVSGDEVPTEGHQNRWPAHKFDLCSIKQREQQKCYVYAACDSEMKIDSGRLERYMKRSLCFLSVYVLFFFGIMIFIHIVINFYSWRITSWRYCFNDEI